MSIPKMLLLSATIGIFTASAFAQGTNDIARVLFRVVNTDASVQAEQGSTVVGPINVTANHQATLELPLGSASVRYPGGARGQFNAPAVISDSRGNITLSLPPQAYENAEIALYSVNGKRILRGKADASKTANALARRNVSAGVYMLSVKGVNGNTFTNRLTHNGGKMNINAAFGVESISQNKQLGKSAAAGDWTMTVSAAGYHPDVRTLANLVKGDNDIGDIILESNAGAEPMSEKTVVQFINDEGITLGWNLGNTLDALSAGVATETGWGNPAATQALFNGVKEQGFNVARIPVTWTGHIGGAPDYTVSAARLNRVEEVVGYAKTAGFKMVIINIHHDGNSFETQHNGWLLISEALKSEANYDQITDKFGKVWTQIANRFKNSGQWLVFEGMNEVHDGSWSMGSNSQGQTDRYNIVNRWNQKFTDAVRATGGNNAKRYLMYAGYAQNPSFTTNSNFALPNDPIGGAGRKMVTIHSYEPFSFAHDANTSIWETTNNKNLITTPFANSKSKFIDNGVPVVIGETGPRYAYAGTDGKGADFLTNRLSHITYYYGKAKEYGLIPIYWDDGTNSNFGMMDRASGQPKNAHCVSAFANMAAAVQ